MGAMMGRKVESKSALEVGRIKTPGLHFVGVVPGLALQVSETGARSWILRIPVGGKRRDMGLGGYPEVTLAMAHEKARGAREAARDGRDPISERQSRQSALKLSAKTFQQCGEAYVAAHRDGWRNAKHAAQWGATLETYAYPAFGSMLVRDVTKAHVFGVLEPIWKEKTETASRLRGRIEKVLDWATARDYRSGPNPAAWKGNLQMMLAAPAKVARKTHHRAMAVDAVGGFFADLQKQEGMGARALEFLVLTAARSGEVRGAVWSEFDQAAQVWTVPAERMKSGRAHRVPLSSGAVALLERLHHSADGDYVFPAQRGRMLSDMTLTAVTRRMGVDAVPHGFRSTFRDWAAERTNYPREVAEMALAHVVAGKVEAAYWRGDLFDKRRQMMGEWARFLRKPAAAGAVVPFNAKGRRAAR